MGSFYMCIFLFTIKDILCNVFHFKTNKERFVYLESTLFFKKWRNKHKQEVNFGC